MGTKYEKFETDFYQTKPCSGNTPVVSLCEIVIICIVCVLSVCHSFIVLDACVCTCSC